MALENIDINYANQKVMALGNFDINYGNHNGICFSPYDLETSIFTNKELNQLFNPQTGPTSSFLI